MKTLVVISFIIGAFYIRAQSPAIDQTKARWILIEGSNENYDYIKYKPNESYKTSLFNFIEYASKQEELFFFLESDLFEYKEKLYVSLVQTERLDTLVFEECYNGITSRMDLNDKDAINLILDQRVYLKDKIGDPILFLDYNGWDNYLFPPKTVFQFDKSVFDNIKIREELIINEATSEKYYKPIGVSIAPYFFNSSSYSIWIDLEKIKSVLEQPYPEWFEYLTNSSSQGKQYMQKE